MEVGIKQWILTNNMDNLGREVYFTCQGKIKVPKFYNKFYNVIYTGVLICHILVIIVFFNSLNFDMSMKPSFKVQNIAQINI